MASFSYATHVRAETGQKRTLALVVADDLTSVAKRAAPPFSGTAARPDRGTNATMPVARWSYDPLQEGDVAFVNRSNAQGVVPGFFLHSVSMEALNAMMAEEKFLVADPQALLTDTPARHSYVCKSGVYERSPPAKVFDKNKLEPSHPARSYILEGVVCAKTDALHADEMIDVGGAEGVVAVGGLSALNGRNHSAVTKTRVLDHVYVILMARPARLGKFALQFGLINSIHVWHGHFEKHYPGATVLAVSQLGRVIDTNYAKDRDHKKLFKIIVAVKPLVARKPSSDPSSPGLVPVDADKILDALSLPESISEKTSFYSAQKNQEQQQKSCKSNLSLRNFSTILKPTVLTAQNIQQIANLQAQVKRLEREREAAKIQAEEAAKETREETTAKKALEKRLAEQQKELKRANEALTELQNSRASEASPLAPTADEVQLAVGNESKPPPSSGLPPPPPPPPPPVLGGGPPPPPPPPPQPPSNNLPKKAPPSNNLPNKAPTLATQPLKTISEFLSQSPESTPSAMETAFKKMQEIKTKQQEITDSIDNSKEADTARKAYEGAYKNYEKEMKDRLEMKRQLNQIEQKQLKRELDRIVKTAGLDKDNQAIEQVRAALDVQRASKEKDLKEKIEKKEKDIKTLISQINEAAETLNARLDDENRGKLGDLDEKLMGAKQRVVSLQNPENLLNDLNKRITNRKNEENGVVQAFIKDTESKIAKVNEIIKTAQEIIKSVYNEDKYKQVDPIIKLNWTRDQGMMVEKWKERLINLKRILKLLKPSEGKVPTLEEKDIEMLEQIATGNIENYKNIIFKLLIETRANSGTGEINELEEFSKLDSLSDSDGEPLAHRLPSEFHKEVHDAMRSHILKHHGLDLGTFAPLPDTV